MEKAVIILNGKNEGKTNFVNHAKSKGYWTWNVNHKNVLSMLCHKLGWDGKRDKNYSAFVDELNNLSNKYFDSEKKYIVSMIEKFSSAEKPNLLIVHSCPQDLTKYILENYNNAYTINITDNSSAVENNEKYCKVLDCTTSSYKEEVEKVLNTLTKEFKEA